MTDSLLLDTHVWARVQGLPGKLRPATAAAIEQAATRKALFVSVISVWELAMLERDGLLALAGGVQEWVSKALNRPGINLLPYTPAIAIESVYLPAPMHKDPCDRILVASARIERLTIVTSDTAMLAFAKASGLPRLRA